MEVEIDLYIAKFHSIQRERLRGIHRHAERERERERESV